MKPIVFNEFATYPSRILVRTVCFPRIVTCVVTNHHHGRSQIPQDPGQVLQTRFNDDALSYHWNIGYELVQHIGGGGFST
jgi:hypothetical protein